MKMKQLLVLVLAMAMLLGTASLAIATQGDSTYKVWSGPGSPHGGYAVNTQKCAVCHAVHHAGAAGDGAGSEALLRSTRADACTYCHISPGVSTLIVYAGLTAKYSVSDLGNAHNSFGGAAGVKCTDCHQVHAATSLMTSSSELSISLLKHIPTSSVTPTRPLSGLAVNRVVPAALDDTETSLAKWCSECHAYYNTTANGASHVMTTTLITAAYQTTPYCKSCHNDTRVSGVASASAFPHYTDGDRFLTSAVSSVAAAVSATDSANDGVCLRCHVSGAGSGVGMSF